MGKRSWNLLSMGSGDEVESRVFPFS